MDFLKVMRYFSYYSSQKRSITNIFFRELYKIRYLHLSKKCGFSIGCNCFGYGLLIHHYGTIVCGSNNRIGNFAVLNTSTCIIQNGSTIGDFFFMGSGAVISKKVSLGNNVKVGANSLVNKSFKESNIVLVGQPAKIKSVDEKTWIDLYDGDDSLVWRLRYEKIIFLKNKMGL